jgi:exosortase
MTGTKAQVDLDPGREASATQRQWSLVGLLVHAFRDPAQRVTVLGAMVCLVLLSILFRDNLWHFYYAWTTDDNYSHGFIVPLVSLYFANQVVQRGPFPIHAGYLLGVVLLAFALAVRLVTIPLPIPFLGDLALLLGLAGGFSLLLGADALKRFWFVFLFLLFMVPLPIAMYSRLASPLQLLASRFASALMNAAGVPVLCEGNRMTLPGGVQMFVAEACSGMRQMTGFLALAAAVAYLTTRPAWYKAIIILAALPIALTANVARVVLTGFTMHFVNPQYASGTYHTLEGILMMGLGLLLLNSLCSLLNLLTFDPPPRREFRAQEMGPRPDATNLPVCSKHALLSNSFVLPGGKVTQNLVALQASEEFP